MIREVIQSMEGMGVYAAVGLVLLMAAFILMLVRVLRMKRDDVEMLGRLPLEASDGAGAEGDQTNG